MAKTTLEQLQQSKDQKMFRILFLNSPWLMSTWADHNEMANAAETIVEEELIGAKITVKAKEKGTDKKWTVASVRVATTFGFTLVFDAPESYLQEKGETVEEHQKRLETLLPCVVGQTFAPKGPIDQKV